MHADHYIYFVIQDRLIGLQFSDWKVEETVLWIYRRRCGQKSIKTARFLRALSSVGLERYLDTVEVKGSNPLGPTKFATFSPSFHYCKRNCKLRGYSAYTHISLQEAPNLLYSIYRFVWYSTTKVYP